MLVKSERAAWAWLAVGVTAYSLGDLAWQFNDYGAGPSIADVLYLLFYPASYIALLLLVRSRVSRFNRSVWLDGITVALAVGAIGAAFLIEFTLDHSEGDRLTVATNLAYPLGDVVLLALVVGVFWLVGRDAGREWVVIAGAFVATSIADAVYLWTATTGTYVEGGILDILWPLMGILLAVAAWVRPGRAKRIALEGRPLVATPIFCTAVALVVFTADHYRTINAAAVALAALSIGIVLVRTVSTLRENGAITARVHLLSMTDPLTHLWNRRRLVADLSEVVGSSGRASRPRALRPQRVQAVQRPLRPSRPAMRCSSASRRSSPSSCVRAERATGSAATSSAHSRGYRQASLEAFLDATAEALSEKGDGFEVTTSFGCVLIPDEARDVSGAMQLADQRLYARKHHSLIERGQPHGVLLQALYEREPGLRDHVSSVAGTQRRARPPARARRARRSARSSSQHSSTTSGSSRSPTRSCRRPSPSPGRSVAFIQQHTVIGERILNAAPALSQIGVDRPRHTRGVRRQRISRRPRRETSIPLAARIIAVCDTYAAITSSRPYQGEAPPRGGARRAAIGLAARARSGAGDAVLPRLRRGRGRR